MPVEVIQYTYAKTTMARWDVEIPTARIGDSLYFPVRFLCGVIGIDSGDQLEAMRADSRFVPALEELAQLTRAGWRPSYWLRRQEAALWIIQIDPARCKITQRGTLQDFQADMMAESDKILFGAAPSASPSQRGEAAYSQQEIIRIFCQECGAPHTITITDGQVTIMRDRR